MKKYLRYERKRASWNDHSIQIWPETRRRRILMKKTSWRKQRKRENNLAWRWRKPRNTLQAPCLKLHRREEMKLLKTTENCGDAVLSAKKLLRKRSQAALNRRRKRAQRISQPGAAALLGAKPSGETAKRAQTSWRRRRKKTASARLIAANRRRLAAADHRRLPAGVLAENVPLRRTTIICSAAGVRRPPTFYWRARHSLASMFEK